MVTLVEVTPTGLGKVIPYKSSPLCGGNTSVVP